MFMQSPRILFLFGVLLLQYSCFFQLAISSTSNLTDQSALLAIKSKLTFDPTNTILGGNWTTKTSFCNWIGVTCSKHRQRVTALDLSFMGLHGTISPHIGNLSFLVSLDLQNNSFFGVLPNEINRLRRLEILILRSNWLVGNIPTTLVRCKKLKTISLAINKLSGQIPKELGSLPRLQKLYLGVNNLVGEIPSSLGNIPTLEELSFSTNGLTGSFPTALLNLSSLVIFSLVKNNISGTLPMDLCLCWPNIQGISLSFNQLSGQIPSTIDQCKEITVLSLSYNMFSGSIPEEIGTLKNLETLYLGNNSLTGTIPPTVGNLSNLKFFGITNNHITGSIPRDLGRLSNLLLLSVSQNSLKGEIPHEIFNMSSLQTFFVAVNFLTGTFPPNTQVYLPNIELLYFGNNQITGYFPSYFPNFTKLLQLDVSINLLYGPVPVNLGSLKHLQLLSLNENQLTGEPGVPELRFLISLFKSSTLEVLVLDENPLNGIIPESFGNYSSSLQIFYAVECQIRGHILNSIGSFQQLTSIYLSDNNMSGKIPSSIGGLEMLQRLYLANNNIEGFIPDEICLLRNLGELSLENNKISGLIPNCVGNLSFLQKVFLNSNKLASSIPANVWNLESLLFLNLSSNSFSGYLPPSIKKSIAIQMIDISWNQITGNISNLTEAFQSLNSLNLSNNLFLGSIPNSLGDMKGLEFLDLSHNTLSGPIPKSLEKLKYLKYLNFSFNKLSGEIPSSGPFVNFTSLSFLENRALCGRQDFGVPPCKTHGTQKSKTSYLFLKYVLPTIASIVIVIALIYMVTRCRKTNVATTCTIEELTKKEHEMISYIELRRATNDFCESNSLGVGSFGSVYKGILSNGTIVAVKVLNLQMEGAIKSFDAECNVWRTIRHRNLVRVITTCSSPEVRALVLQYMSNGSLERWLYSHNYCLNLLQRVSIMIDIASALEYLHQGQSELVVHCDLKPSNVLLDEDMVAHVGDFGLSKILAKNKDATQTKTLGTLGYLAPEYGSEGKVSAKGDVYSFGIMLLEIVTRKKPTEEMFSGELTLRQWINASFPDNIMRIVDNGLLSVEDKRDVTALQRILLSIMDVGMMCSMESLEERIDIKDVVTKLNKIKLALL